MRFHTLSPNTRHGLLAAGLFLIGVSTAVGLGTPEPMPSPDTLTRANAPLESPQAAAPGKHCTSKAG